MSAIPWLGDVYFDTISLKNAYQVTLGKMFQGASKKPNDQNVPYFKSVSVQWGDIKPDPDIRMWVSPSELESLEVLPGDLLVCEGGEVGRCAIYNGPPKHVFEKSIHRVRPIKNNDIRYLRYTLESLHSSDWLDVLCNKATIRHLTGDRLGNLKIPLPSPVEQRRIADFLDIETYRIDRLTHMRRLQAKYLEERFHAVARCRTGRVLLNKGNSTPQGWALLPLRRLISAIRTGGTPPTGGPDVWASNGEPGALPWYGPSAFGLLPRIGWADRQVTHQAITEGVVPTFRAGSTLVIGIGATAGRVAYLDHPATGNQQVTAIVPNEHVDPKFLCWQLWAASSELRVLAPYTTLPIMNNDFLKSFRMAIPLREIQAQSAQHLDRQAEYLDEFSSRTSRIEGLLAERRRALITAAVTGQFDVSSASGRGVEV